MERVSRCGDLIYNNQEKSSRNTGNQHNSKLTIKLAGIKQVSKSEIDNPSPNTGKMHTLKERIPVVTLGNAN